MIEGSGMGMVGSHGYQMTPLSMPRKVRAFQFEAYKSLRTMELRLRHHVNTVQLLGSSNVCVVNTFAYEN